jgi:FtsH-binding integral membrane protein
MPSEAGDASGKAPPWFRGVQTRNGALMFAVLYLLFAVGAGVMASEQVGLPRWLWAAACLGFLLFSLAYWIAARRIGSKRSGSGVSR